MAEDCVEIAIWGRGGQGAKTAGDLITLALHREGFNPQGQPRYSADRMGAPVVYAIRYYRDGRPVWDRSWIREPQFVLLFDLTLLEERSLERQWPPGAMVVANADPANPLLRRLSAFFTATVDANRIARECGLMKGSVPALSSAMPGAFAGATRLLDVERLSDVLPEMNGPLSRYPEPNRRALWAGARDVTYLAAGRPAVGGVPAPHLEAPIAVEVTGAHDPAQAHR